MFMHAAYLLLRREVLDALAKPTESLSLGRLLARLAGLVDLLLRGWHRLAVASDRICRAAGRSRDGTRQGFDLTTHNV
jgi:hypothetical protein